MYALRKPIVCEEIDVIKVHQVYLTHSPAPGKPGHIFSNLQNTAELFESEEFDNVKIIWIISLGTRDGHGGLHRSEVGAARTQDSVSRRVIRGTDS